MFKQQVINELKIDKEFIVLLCNVIIGVFLIRNGGIDAITWHKIKINGTPKYQTEPQFKYGNQ